MKKDMSYFDNLLKSSKSVKKQVAVYLDEAKIERIEAIIKIFSSVSDAKVFTKNSLIEEAVDKFLKESEEYLQEAWNIDVDTWMEEERSQNFDTAIFSAKGCGFEETFLGELEGPCWYPCRVSEARECNVKYIAVYRGQPVSAITHYAVVKEFRFDEERGCKVCYFDGPPIALPHAIGLGERDACYFLGTKYTTLKSLLSAEKADELVFG